jgi:hypothetical protein
MSNITPNPVHNTLPVLDEVEYNSVNYHKDTNNGG